MLNADATVDPKVGLGLIDYADPVVADKMANGAMNVTDAQVCANIRSAIRRGLTQVRPYPARPDRIALVGSGPSLAGTIDELRACVWNGAALVTMNGAYHWCRERNLKPQTQIVMDARPANARFVTPHVPKCNYLLASQCAPEVFDAVRDYPFIRLFHAVVKDEGATSQILDDYYGGAWYGIGGGTTVATRAVFLLRQLGYLHFDLFGVDSCWLGGEHHALPQPENAGDRWTTVRARVKGQTQDREFRVTGWMLKQAEDVMTMLKVNGQHFFLTVHGDGLIAYLLQQLATAPDDVELVETPAAG